MYQSTYSQYFPFATKKTTTYSQFFQCKVHDSKCGDQHLYTYRTITNIKAKWIVRIALFLDSHLRVELFRNLLSLQDSSCIHRKCYTGVLSTWGVGGKIPPKHTNFPTELWQLNSKLSKLAVRLDFLAMNRRVIPQLPGPWNHLRKPQNHFQKAQNTGMSFG